MILLDGKKVADAILKDIADKVKENIRKGNKRPHLAAILVGDNPASQAYVASKVKACDDIGFTSTLLRLDAETSEAELLQKVKSFNENEDIDGILVQLPLPSHIDEQKVIFAIDPKKDVDGFHPVSLGSLVIGAPTFIPATPYGILLMLDHYGIQTSGKHCVVLGRSNIVGTPMSILMSRNADPGNSTVTICHSKTQNIEQICRSADIIVAAIGKPNFVKKDWVNDGAIVIDVGINRIEDNTRKSGSRLVGDVDFENVKHKAAYITPVPGGVGKMTICALMQNTLKATENK